MLYESDVLAVQYFNEVFLKLFRCYKKIHHLIELEHDAISRSCLASIEKITSEKLEIEKTVTSLGASFTNQFENLLRSLRQRKLVSELEISLDALTRQFLSDKAHEDKKDDFIFEVLRHEFKKLNHTYGQLKDLKKSSQTMLEMNQYLLAKLLHHHRETYRFWQNIAMESEATYGAQGTAKKQSQSASIIIRT